MNQLVVFMFLFAAVNAFCALLSGLLWFEHRTALHRSFFLMWCCAVGTLVIAGLVPSSPLMTLASGTPTFLMNLFLADVIRRAIGVRAAWRAYAFTFAGAAILGLALLAGGAPFWAHSLPVAFGLGFPLFHIGVHALRTRGWRALSVTARLVILIAILTGLHELDYPFLRPDPHLAIFGFAIALLSTIALSLTVTGIILEATQADVRRLEAAVIEAERLSALGEAAAVVAHEVRNPLGAIANVVQLLRQETLGAERARELLSIQESEVSRLDRMVQDLLCFARPLTPRFDTVELSEVIRSVTILAQPQAAAASVRLEVDPGPGAQLPADLDHLQMALGNVLQNAIEASPQGGCVRLNVTKNEGELVLRVEDEGAGVPAELQSRVFEPFFTTRARGSGLGLAIAQRIMKAHGGEVRLSNLPRGARFELVFSQR